MVSANINEAFELLVVGMLTVFMILLIVIGLGKVLISFVNKYAPEEEAKKKVAPTPLASSVNAQTKEIIQAAVSQLTGGKGRVANIQKL